VLAAALAEARAQIAQGDVQHVFAADAHRAKLAALRDGGAAVERLESLVAG
jgi:hypothetical protein